MHSTTKSDFQIGVDCLVEMNREYWKSDSTSIAEGEKWIYVFHPVHTVIPKCMIETIVAKALQEREKLPIASIISGRADDLMDMADQIDASFGIEHRFCPSYSSYDSEKIRTLAGKMTAETYGKRDALLSLEYRGVRFGDPLYNDMIRGGREENRGKQFDCFSISQEQYYGHIRDALAAIDQAYEIFEVRKPYCLVLGEHFYTKALYAYVAKVLGAKIFIIHLDKPDIVVQLNSDVRHLSDFKYADQMRIIGERCLEYYQADGISDSGFFIMENGQKDEIEIPEVWKKRKNVFILPHSLGDVPRMGCRYNFYHDYGEWFIETLKIVKDIPDVNWIVKDHPMTHYYGQADYIRSIFETYKTENMFWMDIEYSGLSIKDVADCVLTCTGDTGIEYWAYGIPTITAGDAYYCNWGISYQMKTLDEYKNLLKNISNIPKPSKESVEIAKKYMMALNNWSKHNAYTNLCSEFFWKYVSIMKKGGVPYGVLSWADQERGKLTREFIEAFVKLMKEQDLRESPIYQLKYLCTL